MEIRRFSYNNVRSPSWSRSHDEVFHLFASTLSLQPILFQPPPGEREGEGRPDPRGGLYKRSVCIVSLFLLLYNPETCVFQHQSGITNNNGYVFFIFYWFLDGGGGGCMADSDDTLKREGSLVRGDGFEG